MKSRLSAASIAIYFLLTLSCLTLLTGASNKYKTNTLIMNLNHTILGRCIFNQLLTIQDILILRATCHFFENLIRPNDEAMLTFCNYADFKAIVNVDLYWINVTDFLFFASTLFSK